jgi:integrase
VPRTRPWDVAECQGEPLYETVRTSTGRRHRQRRRALSNDSLNKHVAILARVLKDAQREGWIGHNTAADPERKLRAERPRRSFLEPEQVAALLEGAASLDHARSRLSWETVQRIRGSIEPAVRIASDLGLSDVLVGKVRRGELWTERAQRRERPLRAPIAVLVLAGLRIDELCGLRGRHLDFARKRILVTGELTKTDGGARAVEMSAALLEALESHRERWHYGPGECVFGTRGEGGRDHRRGLSHQPHGDEGPAQCRSATSDQRRPIAAAPVPEARAARPAAPKAAGERRASTRRRGRSRSRAQA